MTHDETRVEREEWREEGRGIETERRGRDEVKHEYVNTFIYNENTIQNG